MAKYIHEGGPDPDAHVKDQLAKQAARALRLNEAPPLSEEQIERERFQAISNQMAEENPLYAAARSASTNFLVVPLEPNGVKPLVDLKDATRDARQLFEFWSTWPDANIGALLGRVGNLIAIRFEDSAAWNRFRDMLSVERRNDDDKTWIEFNDPGGAQVFLTLPTKVFSVRIRGGWGREFERVAAEMERDKRRAYRSQTTYRVWSYPPIQSGQDAFSFPNRGIAPGVTLLGEGVLPWAGSVLDGGLQVEAPMSRPPEIPAFLGRMVGRPRSRKAMAAAREAYDATIAAQEAYWRGIVAAQRAAGEEALRLALAEREKTARAAQEAAE